MGGHCLPVDPFYLTWRAREFHMSTEFIELAGKVNQQMPYYCVERDRARPQRRRQARPRLADRRPGRELQGRRRRHAGVPRAAHHGAAGRARRGALLPRPVRPGAARARPPERRPRGRHIRRRGGPGHRPPAHRPPGAGRSPRSCSWTCAASPAGSPPATWSGSKSLLTGRATHPATYSDGGSGTCHSGGGR